MRIQKLFIIAIFILLVACTAQVQVVPPTVAPAATFPAAPEHVVTVSNNTPAVPTPTPTQPATPAAGVTVTLTGGDYVNLRSGPGAIYPVVVRMPPGTSFTAVAVSEKGEWLLLLTPEISGGRSWVYREYTNYDSAQSPLPAATAAQP